MKEYTLLLHVHIVEGVNAFPSDAPVHIQKQTFSRILSEFMKEKGIIKYRSSELQTILRGIISEAINKGLHERDELRSHVADFLRTRQIYLALWYLAWYLSIY